jgi:uncharacterized membrane protein
MGNKSTRLLPQAGRASRSGQVLAVVAILIMTLLAIVGLVVDSGMVQSARRQARRAADSAAQAGAFALLSGTNAAQRANAVAAATQYAGLNGVSTNGYVVAQAPPEASSNSAFVGSNGYIFVQVTVPVNTTFLRLLMTQRTVNVTASATGGVRMGLCPSRFWCFIRPTAAR